MAIGSVVERNSAVYVYDENGIQRAVIPVSSGEGLQGYTSSRVTVRRAGAAYIYDENGIQVGVIPG